MSYRETRRANKEADSEQRARIAVRKAERKEAARVAEQATPWIHFGNGTYLGGLASIPRPPAAVAVWSDSQALQISFVVGTARPPHRAFVSERHQPRWVAERTEQVRIPWSDVRDVEISDSSDANTKRRQTVTRWAVAGPFAILFPKESTTTTKETLLLVELVDGTKFGFEFDSRSPGCSVADITVKLSQVFRPTPAKEAAPEGMAEQIAKLAALHSEGVLTDQEFAAAKARILAA